MNNNYKFRIENMLRDIENLERQLSELEGTKGEKMDFKMITIKRHVDDLILPQQIPGSDWIDLRAAEDIWIPEHTFALINLGVSMVLPRGYEAQVIPRSSLFKNYGLIQTNSIGLIDNSYCSEKDIWKFPVYCLVGNTVDPNLDAVAPERGTWVHKNDRICQFRIVENQPRIIFDVVDSLSGETRGGFGSTGIK